MIRMDRTGATKLPLPPFPDIRQGDQRAFDSLLPSSLYEKMQGVFAYLKGR